MHQFQVHSQNNLHKSAIVTGPVILWIYQVGTEENKMAKVSFKCTCGRACRMESGELNELVNDGIKPLCAKCDDKRVGDENTKMTYVCEDAGGTLWDVG